MQKRKKQRTKTKPRPKRNQYQDNRIITFNRTIVPDSVRTRLVWLDPNNVLNNSGAAFVAKRFRPTGIYDIDPLLGGSSVAGFTEWAAFYYKYRVIHTNLTFHCANYDTGTVLQVVTLPLNVDPGATPTLSDIQNWTLQPFARHSLLSKSGGMDRCTLKLNINLRNFVGTDTFLVDDSYSSAVTNVPQNNVYVAVGAFVIGGLTMTNGIGYSLTISSIVEFFERKELNV